MWTLNFLGKFQGLLPFVLRMTVGWHFASSAWHKMQAKGGKWDWGRSYVETWLSGHNVHLVTAILVLELVAGAGVLVGALTRWSALLLLVVCGYAVFHVYWGRGYRSPEDDFRVYAAAVLAVAAVGPGSLSVDRILFGKKALEG
jgi:uncharacterized membrane protein YphA (DoxX/SURF4 family)